MSDENANAALRKPEEFYTRKQALKAQEVLRMVCSVQTMLEEFPKQGRTWFVLKFDPENAGKIKKLEKEIDTVCMIVRCFEVGQMLPTEMYVDMGSVFPTDMLTNPPEDSSSGA